MATSDTVAAAASSLETPVKTGEDPKPASGEELVKAKSADTQNGDPESEPPKPVETNSKKDTVVSNGGAASQVPQTRKSVEDRERDAQKSLRAEQGQRWNKRDRHQGEDKVHWKHGRQNKFDPTSQKESSDPNEIRKQVEFYFSDSNLMTDRFLFQKIEGHKNLAVPIDVIHSFKRMRRFQPRSVVVEALKESQTLRIVDNDTAIQRKEALSEDLVGKPMEELQKVHETASMARSVYVKGFGDEESQTQFDIEAFFANYGPTNSVRLRRRDMGLFKGSVFAEFDSEETAKSFLALEPKPTWKGKELTIKSKKDYCDEKVEDIKAGKIRPNSPHSGHRNGNASSDAKKREDGRDWKERRNEDRARGFKNKSERGRGKQNRGQRRDHSSRDKADEKAKADAPAPHAADGEAKGSESEPQETPVDPPAESKGLFVPAASDLKTIGPPVNVEHALEDAQAEFQRINSKKRALEDPEAEVQSREKKVDTKGA